MHEKDKKPKHFMAVVRLSVVAIASVVLAIGIAVAQDPPLAVPLGAFALILSAP